ncbi:hypothetical protein D5E79_26500, partial [Vibrio parahaemolyticus]
GTLGEKKVNHGCEARGIRQIFAFPMHRHPLKHGCAEFQTPQGLNGVDLVLLRCLKRWFRRQIINTKGSTVWQRKFTKPPISMF